MRTDVNPSFLFTPNIFVGMTLFSKNKTKNYWIILLMENMRFLFLRLFFSLRCWVICLLNVRNWYPDQYRISNLTNHTGNNYTDRITWRFGAATADFFFVVVVVAGASVCSIAISEVAHTFINKWRFVQILESTFGFIVSFRMKMKTYGQWSSCCDTQNHFSCNLI